MAEILERATLALFEELRRQDKSEGSLLGYREADGSKTILDGAYDLKKAMRSAVEALREPTEAMEAAKDAIDMSEATDGIWPAMLSAILKEEGE